ncbi:MAG TPA: FG-GAP repeat protein [Polyangia bacterium]|jgi:hypothetical protein|nr:FG-GAP repeat protein [Polyangia bacterium]
MRGSAKFVLGACAAGLLAAGCDWRDFDTLKDQAPVLRIDPPSGFASASDFGNAVLPVAPPADGSTAAWFLASGTESLGLALVEIDAAGGSSAQTLSGSAIDNLEGNPVTAMAEIPGTGKALVGAPTFGSLLTIDLESAAATPFVPASLATSSEALFGDGVAAGNLTGGAAPDLVVASDTSLHVFVDSSTTDIAPGTADLAACPITLATSLSSHDRLTRAVVIGNLLGGGAVIAIGTPGAAAPGTVAFFSVAAGVVSCAGVLAAPALTAPPATTNSGFGAVLAIGDFDGDGVSDLLVGAPPFGAYLYKGPLTLPGSAPTATIPPPSGNGSFGYALAAMSLDGKLGDEALIGDPGATVNDQTDAGNVTIYTGPKLALMAAPTPVLTDHESAAGEGYGAVVAALPFCAMAPCTTNTVLPLVGASSRIFTYFMLGPVDPRAK